MTDQQKKYAKIAVIAVIVVVVVYLLYSYFTGGNAYASKSTLAEVKSGTHGTWNESKVNDLATALSAIDNTPVWTGAELPIWSKGNIYGLAWLKGMNVAIDSANVNAFKADITKYVKNASLRKPHYEVTVGEFLNAK